MSQSARILQQSGRRRRRSFSWVLENWNERSANRAAESCSLLLLLLLLSGFKRKYSDRKSWSPRRRGATRSWSSSSPREEEDLRRLKLRMFCEHGRGSPGTRELGYPRRRRWWWRCRWEEARGWWWRSRWSWCSQASVLQLFFCFRLWFTLRPFLFPCLSAGFAKV